jgi:hypothetical protein
MRPTGLDPGAYRDSIDPREVGRLCREDPKLSPAAPGVGRRSARGAGQRDTTQTCHAGDSKKPPHAEDEK